jgi:vacuolar-type H+-ATPase subunit I/STV1
MMKVLTGKYELLEGKDVDEKLKELCYKMIKLVMIYIVKYIVHIHLYMNIYFLYCVLKKAEERVKISEMLEEDVLKEGIEKINRDEEMEQLKEENKKIKEELKKRDKEIEKIKEEKEKEKEKFSEEIRKRDEENKKIKQEIIILQKQLKEAKIADDEKSYNKSFTLCFVFFFSFWYRSC